MNYPKEFYITTPIVGDKVWIDVDKFIDGKKAFHGPWWIKDVHQVGGLTGIRLRRENGKDGLVLLTQLLRMSKSEIKKMAVLPSKPA